MIVALDLETLERPIPESLQKEKKEHFLQRAAERYKKEEIIAKHAIDDLKAWESKWKFTRQGAEIIAVGLCEVDRYEHKAGKPECIYLPNSGEGNVIRDAIAWMNDNHVTALVGVNSFGFDFPLFCSAMARHGHYLNIPIGKWSWVDLQKHGFEKYTSQTESLDSLCEIYGVTQSYNVRDFPNPDGSQVAAMHTADKSDGHRRVYDYCLEDVRVTAELAARISSFMQLV